MINLNNLTMFSFVWSLKFNRLNEYEVTFFIDYLVNASRDGQYNHATCYKFNVCAKIENITLLKQQFYVSY